MASKSKRRRKVLGASCILAALIIAGSSFAWFTGKDEVTNRLTATADYGVSLVEDFTPPKDMTPGQEVNKDVSVVNTGAIDALVRVSLQNDMNDMSRLNHSPLSTDTVDANKGVTVYKKTDGTVAEKDRVNASTSATMGADETKLYDLKGFGDPTSFSIPAGAVELNPMESISNDGTKKANEVTTLMAGGRVIIAESKAVAPDKQAKRSGDDINGATGFTIIYNMTSDEAAHNNIPVEYDGTNYWELEKNQDGLYVRKGGSALTFGANEDYSIAVSSLARDYSGAGQYKPVNSGLYVFKRNEGTTDKYSGFYYVSGTKKFYALETEDGNTSPNIKFYDYSTDMDGAISYDATVTDVVDSVTGINILTKETGLNNTTGTWSVTFGESEVDTTWTATPTASDKYMKAIYHVTADGNGNNERDVVYFIKLKDNWQNEWDFVPDSTSGKAKDGTNNNGLGYFYYKDKLESGETTNKLIDSVKLADTMNTTNYLDMVYDLHVALDTAQVTKDDQGHETATAVTTTGDYKWATPTLDKGGDGVIDSIDWA